MIGLLIASNTPWSKAQRCVKRQTDPVLRPSKISFVSVSFYLPSCHLIPLLLQGVTLLLTLDK
jgi:hypothetical protein